MSQYKVFISYSRKDYSKVQPIVQYLIDNGVSVWFDKDGIYAGDDFKGKIATAIDNSDNVLFFSSTSSNASRWTAKEINVALDKEKRIIPCRLDNSPYNNSLILELAGLDYVNFTDKNIYEDEKLRLLRFFTDEPVPYESGTETGFESQFKWLMDIFDRYKIAVTGCSLTMAILAAVLILQKPTDISDNYRNIAEKVFPKMASLKDADTRYFMIVDYSIPSNQNRFFLWDTVKGGIIEQFWCAHGKGGGSTPEKPVFSNVRNSLCSSLGWYLVGETCYTDRRYSYKYHIVDGLDPTNNNARERGFQLHPLSLVDNDQQKAIKNPMPMDGRCEGNFTMSHKDFNCLDRYIHSTDKRILLYAIDGQDN